MLVGTSSLSREQMIEYLRTLPSIRERCGRVHDLAKQGKLQYFDYHPENEEIVTDYCIRIIRVRTLFRCCALPLSDDDSSDDQRDYGDDFSTVSYHHRHANLDCQGNLTIFRFPPTAGGDISTPASLASRHLSLTGTLWNQPPTAKRRPSA